MEDIRFSTQINFDINNVGYISVVRNKGFSIRFKAGKPIYSFVYVKKGKMKYDFSEKSFTATEGQVIFVPKDLPYEATYLEMDTTMKMITFDVISDESMSCLMNPVKNDDFDFENVFKSVTPRNMRNPVLLMSKAFELVYLMQGSALDTPKKYSKIVPAIDEITRKYYDNNPVSYYAKLCKMGESNFRRLFKEYTGKSLVDYRNSIRIFEAKKLIQSGEYSVQDAAYTVGFNNMSFYYEVIKKQDFSCK